MTNLTDIIRDTATANDCTVTDTRHRNTWNVTANNYADCRDVDAYETLAAFVGVEFRCGAERLTFMLGPCPDSSADGTFWVRIVRAR